MIRNKKHWRNSNRRIFPKVTPLWATASLQRSVYSGPRTKSGKRVPQALK
jgi:hypothetical protein